jgi:hypothetical protein
MLLNLVRWYSQAAKVDDLKKRNPDHAELLDALNEGDPSSTKKYLEWMFKQVTKNSAPEDELIETVQEYNKYLQRMEIKDHTKFTSWKEMKKEIEKALKKETKSDRKVLGEAGIKMLGEKEGWTLYHVLSRFGAIKLGTKARWSISTTGKDNLFDYYSSTGTQFYVLKYDDPPAAGLEPHCEKFLISFYGEVGEDLFDANNASYNVLSPDLLGKSIQNYDVAEWALELASKNARKARSSRKKKANP